MRLDTVILFSIILILGSALAMSLFYRPRTDKLKHHIASLAERQLQMSRGTLNVPHTHGYNNYEYPYGTSVSYQKGLEGPLKFYAPTEQQYNNRWQKVGIIMSVSPTDDTIYNLEQRSVFPFTEDNFEYRAHDTFKGVYINLPSQSGKKLYNRDTFTVPGKESIGLFEVARDSDYYMVPL